MAANTKALFKEWNKDDQIKGLDNYKMDPGDFTLWLKYLNTHPLKPTYQEFREFKNNIAKKTVTLHKEKSKFYIKLDDKIIMECTGLVDEMMKIRIKTNK